MIDNKKSIDELFLCIKREDKLKEFKKAFGLKHVNTEDCKLQRLYKRI